MIEEDTTRQQPERISVKAYDVASAFDLVAARKVLEEGLHGKLLEDNPLLVQFGPQKMVGVFDYGAMVFFDVDRAARSDFIDKLRAFASRENKIYSEDEFILNLGARAGKPEGTDELVIKEFNRDIALVVGAVLSRSVSVEFYETLVADALKQLEDPIASLQDTGKIPYGQRELTKKVGFALAVEQELAYTLSVFDDPDIVWEGGKPIEELYRNLKREFDLEDRIRIIQQKVSIISRSSTFVISRIEGKRSQLLEWIIILLIVLEILLVLFGKMS